MKRRDILKIGAATAGLGFPAIIRAQQKEVVILGLWDQTGAFADVGPLNDRGMRMALEERDMKILGRPVKYVTRDGATMKSDGPAGSPDPAGDVVAFHRNGFSHVTALTQSAPLPSDWLRRFSR